MKKKLAILGRGTAGAFALAHFSKFTNCEIEVYHDPAVPQQAVGEGSTLIVPTNLFTTVGFTYDQLSRVDGSFKMGVHKTGWAGHDFTHVFRPPTVAMHFNAIKLQDYIFQTLAGRYCMIESGVTDYAAIDADYVMDCSGKPANYTDFNLLETVPVNSVHVTQCYWDAPRFQYTLALARPWGWVFGIPLQNRCSIGYMYNNTICSIDDVKADVQAVFQEYNLTPSTDTNSFSFRNYYRKKNFSDRVARNGNASFFLEPMEATSIAAMIQINRYAWDLWFGTHYTDFSNDLYTKMITQVENMIMLHYCAGSRFDTEFWDFAQARADRHIKSSLKQDSEFVAAINQSMLPIDQHDPLREYGTWPSYSFKQNLEGMALYPRLRKMSKLVDRPVK
jgi:Tryptophan halogenase